MLRIAGVGCLGCGVLAFLVFGTGGLLSMRSCPNARQLLPPSISSESHHQAVLNLAHRMKGARYQIGGADPSGFDCSGFVYYVFRTAVGYNMPRAMARQRSMHRSVEFPHLQPGDLVFFRNSRRELNHVGIYIGEGDFLHASQDQGRVVRSSLSKPYFRRNLIAARRVLSGS